MQTVIIVIHLMVVIALVGVVLLQRSDGGALGIGGGGGFMTGRGQANALTRATAILAALFFLTSLTLTILANFNRAPKSIFDGVAPAGQDFGFRVGLARRQADKPAAAASSTSCNSSSSKRASSRAASPRRRRLQWRPNRRSRD